MPVIFDLDGTLVDTRPDLLVAVNQMLDDYQERPVNAEQLSGGVGRGAAHLVQHCWRCSSTEPEPDDLEAVFNRVYRDINGQQAELYSGINALLSDLHSDGIAMAICTNKNQQLAGRLVKKLGVDHCFNAVIGDTGGALKPDPAMVQACINSINNGQKIYMVGDTRADLMAARGAGIDFIGVGYGFGGESLKSEHVSHFAADTNKLYDVLVRSELCL